VIANKDLWPFTLFVKEGCLSAAIRLDRRIDYQIERARKFSKSGPLGPVCYKNRCILRKNTNQQPKVLFSLFLPNVELSRPIEDLDQLDRKIIKNVTAFFLRSC
jgi:hypothetical protein